MILQCNDWRNCHNILNDSDNHRDFMTNIQVKHATKFFLIQKHKKYNLNILTRYQDGINKANEVTFCLVISLQPPKYLTY